MIYDSIFIADYIVEYSLNNEIDITNLKLQKVLYYAQAAFLVEKNIECFKEEILAWRHGPIEKKVYDKYKKYSDSQITSTKDIYYELVKEMNYNVKEQKLQKNDIELINKVISSYKNYSAWELVKKTHKEKPWQSSFQDNFNNIISKEKIKNFYHNNRGLIYGC